MASIEDVVRSIDALRTEDHAMMVLITAINDRLSALEKAVHISPSASSRASSFTLANSEVSSDEEESGIAVDAMSLTRQPKKQRLQMAFPSRSSDTAAHLSKLGEIKLKKHKLEELKLDRLKPTQPKPPTLCADDLKTHLKPIRDEMSLLTGCVFGIERRLKSLTEEAGTEPFIKAANRLAVKNLTDKYEHFKMPTLNSPPKSALTASLSMPSSATTTIISSSSSSSDTKIHKPFSAENRVFRLPESIKAKAHVPDKAPFSSNKFQPPLLQPFTFPPPTVTLPPSQLPKPTTPASAHSHNMPKPRIARPLSLSASTPRRPSTLRNITNTSNARSSPFSIPEQPRPVIFGQPSTPSLPPKYNFDFNVAKSPFGGYAKSEAGDESPFGKLPKSKKRMSTGHAAGRTGGGKLHSRVSWLDTAGLSLSTVPKSEGTVMPRSPAAVNGGAGGAGPTWPTVFAPKDGSGAPASLAKGMAKDKENDAKKAHEGRENVRERNGDSESTGFSQERETRHSVG